MKVENPKISAVIITDGDVNVINAIDSIYETCYEIILVNTVKTEKVKELTRNYKKVRYFYFKWVNDFSKARNYGIKKAKGDWILTIDDDEVLKFPKVIKTLDTDYLAYMTKQVSHGQISEGKGFWTARLFQNNKGIFYKGKVHETIDHLLDSFSCVNSDIILDHSGYDITEDEMQKKLQRNYKIMMTDKKNIMYNVHMGSLYTARKEYKQAILFFNAAMKDRLNDAHFAVIQNNIHICHFLMEEPLEILLTDLKRSLMYEPFQYYARVNILEHLLSVMNEDNKGKYIFLIREQLEKIERIFNDGLSNLLFNEITMTQEYIDQKYEELKKWDNTIERIAI